MVYISSFRSLYLQFVSTVSWQWQWLVQIFYFILWELLRSNFIVPKCESEGKYCKCQEENLCYVFSNTNLGTCFMDFGTCLTESYYSQNIIRRSNVVVVFLCTSQGDDCRLGLGVGAADTPHPTGLLPRRHPAGRGVVRRQQAQRTRHPSFRVNNEVTNPIQSSGSSIKNQTCLQKIKFVWMILICLNDNIIEHLKKFS